MKCIIEGLNKPHAQFNCVIVGKMEGYMIFDDILTVVMILIVDKGSIMIFCILYGEMDPTTTWFDYTYQTMIYQNQRIINFYFQSIILLQIMNCLYKFELDVTSSWLRKFVISKLPNKLDVINSFLVHLMCTNNWLPIN